MCRPSALGNAKGTYVQVIYSSVVVFKRWGKGGGVGRVLYIQSIILKAG